MSFQAVADSLLFTKNDPQDLRLGDLAKKANFNIDLGKSSLAKNWAVVGYPDDQGIAMNGGRTGASEAPNAIRKYFYKMTPTTAKPDFDVFDFGNLICPGPRQKTLGIGVIPQSSDSDSLATRHQTALSSVQKILSSELRLITLGGGHDYGFPDAAGFLETAKSKSPGKKPLVINFDAHLDVRPTDQGFHSGTPFRRLLEIYEGNFEFIEVGLQPQCNSPAHRSWAQDHGAALIDLVNIQNSYPASSLAGLLSEAVDPDVMRPLWISVDIDAFCSAEAPGCSQSWATGLQISSFLPALYELKKNFNLCGMGIYEVSPPLDSDDRTSKLAALLMHHLIFAGSN